MQAIHTKFLGATNSRGSRYKATCEAGTITLGADHALGSEENHTRAARALITKLGWWHDDARGDRYGDWFSGGTADGYVFVCTVEYAKLEAPAPVLGRCTDCGQACRAHQTQCDACAETESLRPVAQSTLSSRQGLRAAGFPEAAVRAFHNRHED